MVLWQPVCLGIYLHIVEIRIGTSPWKPSSRLKQVFAVIMFYFDNYFTDYPNDYIFNDLDIILWVPNSGISNFIVS